MWFFNSNADPTNCPVNTALNTVLKLAAIFSVVALFLLPLSVALANAPGEEPFKDPDPIIEAVAGKPTDESIETRLTSIYSQIEALSTVKVTVKEGVVLLSGSVSNDSLATRALSLAIRIEGVVTVDDGIERSLDLEGNVMPMVDQFLSDLQRWARALPLVALALTVFFFIAYLGHRLAKWSTLWRRLTPNPFLAELLGQAVRIAAILIGFVVSLNLVGATALMGTILGGAGVAGLAISFAVRDSMENYISSIMLSFRQPFRANDHVVIDQHEGKVVRLTSRATVLMTLDGNHLRIPNSTVFKAAILNYTTNPERRFEFELGIDADDDPIAAMKIGLDAVGGLAFVLNDPEPSAVITVVGDSNIVIKFMAWVDQVQSDFGKARSLAIRSAMDVLQERGFTLPEPIYRLRFDQQQAKHLLESKNTATVDINDANIGKNSLSLNNDYMSEMLDVRPDTHLEEKINDERALDGENDLLDNQRPVE